MQLVLSYKSTQQRCRMELKLLKNMDMKRIKFLVKQYKLSNAYFPNKVQFLKYFYTILDACSAQYFISKKIKCDKYFRIISLISRFQTKHGADNRFYLRLWNLVGMLEKKWGFYNKYANLGRRGCNVQSVKECKK